MKGFGHYIHAGNFYVCILSILTLILLDLSLFVIVIIATGLSLSSAFLQMVEARKEKLYHGIKATDETNKIKKRKLYNQFHWLRRVCMTLLFIAVLLLALFHSGLALNKHSHFNPIFLFLGLFLALLGGAVPDHDFMLGVQTHRDPFTHSSVLGIVIAILCLFFVENSLIPFTIVFSGLLIGMASHLFCDIITAGSSGIEALKSVFNWKQTAGDIRQITEGKEQLYLVANGSLLLFFAFFLLIRSLTLRIQFPSFVEGGDIYTIIWFLISLFLFTLPYLMFFKFRDQKKRK